MMNQLVPLLLLFLLNKKGGASAPTWPTPRHPPPRKPAAPIPPTPPVDAMKPSPPPLPRKRKAPAKRKPAPVRVPPPRSSAPVATRMPSADHPPPPAPDAPVVTVHRPHVVRVPTTADTRNAIAAANQLYDYVRAKQPLGTKARPSDFVQDAQRDMGNLIPDGIYGPATRTRGKELTGKNFPPRGAITGNGTIYIP